MVKEVVEFGDPPLGFGDLGRKLQTEGVNLSGLLCQFPPSFGSAFCRDLRY